MGHSVGSGAGFVPGHCFICCKTHQCCHRPAATKARRVRAGSVGFAARRSRDALRRGRKCLLGDKTPGTEGLSSSGRGRNERPNPGTSQSQSEYLDASFLKWRTPSAAGRNPERRALSSSRYIQLQMCCFPEDSLQQSRNGWVQCRAGS